MAEIQFKNISKSFGNTKVIDNLNLTIEEGKFTVLVGPSGCGKTTLLRMIAGIELQTSGQIFINGKNVSRTSPGKRDVAMVFQNYAIYPTMTVRGNIEYGLKNNKVSREKREELINNITSIVGLKPYLDRKPSTLSGGQRQRIALARAMVKQPAVFLMDEPLSNLDAKLRAQMRLELIELHKKLGTTFVYVTHDQIEAMSMADQIILMNDGKIQQEASPEEIYFEPKNLFTAQFMGTPPMNILNVSNDVQYKMGFRPEVAQLSEDIKTNNGMNLKGVIITREMLGSETIYQVKNSEQTFMVKSTNRNFKVGMEVHVTVTYDDLIFFDLQGSAISLTNDEISSILMKQQGEKQWSL
ncbi:ABC transporter ATP-binding protein [Lysinibacillus sp. PLM2]|nr:ABC transporter ATP-binding protein [Lysinibacillus sp. PLM2]